MQIQGVYAALATTDIRKSEEFYSYLFGKAPDDRPMVRLIQWRDVAGANIQVFEDRDTAGSGRLTIVVPDMADARNALKKIGVALLGESQGDYGRIAQVSDTDENRITLAEPPTRPFAR